MIANAKALKFCFLILRLTFLSCWRLEKSEDKLVAKCSKISVLANISMAGFLLYLFFKMVNFQNQPTIYKQSSLVFPLYTELLILVKVIFLFYGNYYMGKFVEVVNYFPPVVNRLECVFPTHRYHWKFKSKTILKTWLAILAVLTFMLIYIEYNVVLSYPKFIRFVHFFAFYCAAAFSINFAVSMDYVRENYVYLNFLFDKILADAGENRGSDMEARRNVGRKKGEEEEEEEEETIVSHVGPSDESSEILMRRKIQTWMTSFMELRLVEEMVNEIFGKKIFISMVICFSAIMINMFYFVALNLYRTSNIWINLCFLGGLVEAVLLLFNNIMAAEITSREVNKVNHVILYFPISRDDWYHYKQVRYFMMFLYTHPTQFRAWVFYELNYSLFFKVVATASAICIVFLQCEFMRSKMN